MPSTRINKTICLWYDPDSFCSFLFICESRTNNMLMALEGPSKLEKACSVVLYVAGVCLVKSMTVFSAWYEFEADLTTQTPLDNVFL